MLKVTFGNLLQSDAQFFIFARTSANKNIRTKIISVRQKHFVTGLSIKCLQLMNKHALLTVSLFSLNANRKLLGLRCVPVPCCTPPLCCCRKQKCSLRAAQQEVILLFGRFLCARALMERHQRARCKTVVYSSTSHAVPYRTLCMNEA